MTTQTRREPRYDPEALRQGIEKCKKSIEIFQDAVQKELRTLARFEALLAQAEERENN